MPSLSSQSAAQALHLPTDDYASERRSASPLWRVRNPDTFTSSSTLNRSQNLREQVLQEARKAQKSAVAIWNKLELWQKIALIVFNIFLAVGGILFLIYSESIFEWLGPVADKWRALPFGWLIIWLAIFFISVPPMIGYSLCTTICGFVWRLPQGWFIVASATLVGSCFGFIVSRTVMSDFVNRKIAKDKRFAALALTLKHDGLKLLFMIRLCPLPYSLSNGALATFPTVTLTNFALATALATPKLFIHVFIGSRMRALADSGDKMDTKTKVINYLSIAFGVLVGIGIGTYIYRQTQIRSQELEAQEAANARGQAPGLSREYSDDPNEQIASRTLRREDEISLHTQDNDEYRDDLEDDDLGYDDPFTLGDEESSPNTGRRR